MLLRWGGAGGRIRDGFLEKVILEMDFEGYYEVTKWRMKKGLSRWQKPHVQRPRGERRAGCIWIDCSRVRKDLGQPN